MVLLYVNLILTGGGYGMAIYHTFWTNLPHLKQSHDHNAEDEDEDEDEDFSLLGFPAGYKYKFEDLPFLMKQAKGVPPFLHSAFQGWLETDALLFNTVEEIDHVGLNYFRQQFSCYVCSIGPVISPSKDTIITSLCTQWLDSKPSRSVLYVAFGSQITPSAAQSMELAISLEASEVNFIWAARPPFIMSPENQEWLPEGFQERIEKSKRGLLLLQWAPQQEILSHNSVGGFLTHCGWNSIIEALSNGVPMLSWPMEFEQPFNAKMLEEEVGVCIRVANGMENKVNQQEISDKIKKIINGIEGTVIRRKAQQVRDILKNATWDQEGHKGSSSKQLDKILDAAMHYN